MILLIRILACLSFLLYASYSDFKTMTVPNNLWLCMAVIGLVLVPIHIVVAGVNVVNNFVIYILLVTIVSILAYILFSIDAIGGADAKGIIAFIILVPEFVFGSIVNASLLLIMLVILFLVYNVIKTNNIKVVISYMEDKVPFMPILTIGFIITVLTGGIKI